MNLTGARDTARRVRRAVAPGGLARHASRRQGDRTAWRMCREGPPPVPRLVRAKFVAGLLQKGVSRSSPRAKSFAAWRGTNRVTEGLGWRNEIGRARANQNRPTERDRRRAPGLAQGCRQPSAQPSGTDQHDQSQAHSSRSIRPGRPVLIRLAYPQARPDPDPASAPIMPPERTNSSSGPSQATPSASTPAKAAASNYTPIYAQRQPIRRSQKACKFCRKSKGPLPAGCKGGGGARLGMSC